MSEQDHIAELEKLEKKFEDLTNEIHRKTDSEQQPKWYKFVFGAAGVIVTLIVQAVGLIWFLSQLSFQVAANGEAIQAVEEQQSTYITLEDEELRHNALQQQINTNTSHIQTHNDTAAKEFEKIDRKMDKVIDILLERNGRGAP